MGGIMGDKGRLVDKIREGRPGLGEWAGVLAAENRPPVRPCNLREQRPCGEGCPCPEIRAFRTAWWELLERVAEMENLTAKYRALAEEAYYMSRQLAGNKAGEVAERVLRRVRLDCSLEEARRAEGDCE